ncbi:basic proline-rich protein-like [Ovis aries]|uniref:basic proline-rich protein-like n=1 Tax=Ovis aries TaxID=9940 RepID=UPI001C2E15FC|nr:basic proline-rich protein-like [Ovis aries]
MAQTPLQQKASGSSYTREKEGHEVTAVDDLRTQRLGEPAAGITANPGGPPRRGPSTKSPWTNGYIDRRDGPATGFDPKPPGTSPPPTPAPGNICRAGTPRLHLQRLGPSKPNASQSRGLRLPPRSAVCGARSGDPRRERTEGGGRSGPDLGLSRLSCRVDLVTVPSALRNPFSEERTLRTPRLRVEGREHGDSGPGPRSRAVAAVGRPLQAAVGSGGPGSRRQDAPPAPLAPTREGARGEQEPGTPVRSPPPADLGRPSGSPSRPPHPGVPVPPPPPSRRSRPLPFLEEDPVSSEGDTYPGRAGSRRGPRSQVGRGKVRLRCAGCGASRAPCTAARLGLPLPRARPRRSAALPACRPRPDPPLPAQGCGPRRREQRILGPSSPLPGRARHIIVEIIIQGQY